MAFVLAHLELILSALGLGVIFLVPAVVNPKPDDWWQVVALTAALVGLIHGIIFWLIRKRQRLIRAQLLDELRTVLADVINNQLTVLRLQARKLSSTSDTTPVEEHLHVVHESVKVISDYINLLSEESLRQWKDRYERPVR